MTKHDKIEADQTAPSIFSAIATAASQVKVLGKSERNKFDGYDFVSIDKFLALVNPICSKNGLFPIVSQSSVEFYDNTNSKGGKSTWARFHYDITLYHSSGETLGPVSVMVSVPMNGAQATGSAQSYALKQFFRSTLMIPTGDKDDADLIPTEQHHSQSVTPEQFIALRDKCEQWGGDQAKFLKAYGAQSLEQFPAANLDRAMKALDLKIAEVANPPVQEDEIPY